MDNIEDLYRSALQNELGVNNDIESLYSNAIQQELTTITSTKTIIPTSIYEGEHAFRMFIHCIKSDIGPSGDKSGKIYYRLKIVNLDHDTLMVILTSLKDIFPSENKVSSKRSRLSKELNALSLGHLSKWITNLKNGFYTLDIRHIPYNKITTLVRILFGW